MRMKHIFYRAFVLLSIGGLVGACNTDNDTNFIENSILGAPHFSPLKDSIPLEYTNIKVNAIQGNSLLEKKVPHKKLVRIMRMKLLKRYICTYPFILQSKLLEMEITRQ